MAQTQSVGAIIIYEENILTSYSNDHCYINKRACKSLTHTPVPVIQPIMPMIPSTEPIKIS